MVITVTCPSCSSAFPVDPAKIPERGVNARCSSCGDIFRVERPAPEPELPTLEAFAPDPEPAPPAAPPAATMQAPPPPAPEPPLAPPKPEAAPAPPPMQEPAPPAFEAPPAPAAAPPPVPAVPEVPAMPEPPAPAADPFSEAAPFESKPASEPAEPAAAPVAGFTFGKRDPTDKAKRLARVLVSDMIMYNAERHQSALAQGTLVQDFEDEIEKSWKEFVEQVGEELANGAGRQYWTDALNDILAKGEQVF